MQDYRNIASAVIVAAGSGKRFGGSVSKQFVDLCGKPLLYYSISCFLKTHLIEQVVLVVPEDSIEHTTQFIDSNFGNYGNIKITNGGKERQDSVLKGIELISPESRIVVIHDGARPLITVDLVNDVILASLDTGAAILAMPTCNTVKQSGTGIFIDKTLPRDKLWLAQTPQAFNIELLKTSYNKVDFEKTAATDESMLLEEMGVKVKIVKGSEFNIKVTSKNDLFLCESILERGLYNN